MFPAATFRAQGMWVVRYPGCRSLYSLCPGLGSSCPFGACSSFCVYVCKVKSDKSVFLKAWPLAKNWIRILLIWTDKKKTGRALPNAFPRARYMIYEDSDNKNNKNNRWDVHGLKAQKEPSPGQSETSWSGTLGKMYPDGPRPAGARGNVWNVFPYETSNVPCCLFAFPFGPYTSARLNQINPYSKTWPRAKNWIRILLIWTDTNKGACMSNGVYYVRRVKSVKSDKSVFNTFPFSEIKNIGLLWGKHPYFRCKTSGLLPKEVRCFATSGPLPLLPLPPKKVLWKFLSDYHSIISRTYL